MRRHLGLILATSIAAAAATLTAQSPRLAPRAAAAKTVDGHPDLHGVWTNATITPFERPAALADKAFLTDDEAAQFERRAATTRDEEAPPRAGDVGNYNQFWFDSGDRVVSTRRTSLVVDPPDGRVPALTAAARAKAAARNADNREHPADGPENRSLQERCLSFNAGPPINLGPYNNYVRLFEMPNAVIIFTEMIHDARIVWMDGRPHLPPHVKLWLGDSRGHWEGKTLVVDTTNFTEKTGFRGSSDQLHLIERFTRVDAGTLQYEYTVDDPATFTKPWTAVLPMTRSDERMYEYACQEGNYALPDILRGARYEEKQKDRR